MATTPASVDDTGSFQSPVGRRNWRRVAGFAGLGVAAYAVALVASFPAAIVVPDAGGTLWNGSLALPGATRAEWQWRPMRSLWRLGFAVDWTARGQGTDLAGAALLRPSGVMLDRVAGEADSALLGALDLPFGCSMPLQIDIAHAAIGGAEQAFDGTIRSGAGQCQRPGDAMATAVAPLVARADGEGRIVITPAASRGTKLVDLTLGKAGAIDIVVTPEGGQALPFAAPPAGLTLSTTL